VLRPSPRAALVGHVVFFLHQDAFLLFLLCGWLDIGFRATSASGEQVKKVVIFPVIGLLVCLLA
jgi:hypothetical protein